MLSEVIHAQREVGPDGASQNASRAGNYGRNNNSPATGFISPEMRVTPQLSDDLDRGSKPDDIFGLKLTIAVRGLC